jgi:hypothetical protein
MLFSSLQTRSRKIQIFQGFQRWELKYTIPRLILQRQSWKVFLVRWYWTLLPMGWAASFLPRCLSVNFRSCCSCGGNWRLVQARWSDLLQLRGDLYIFDPVFTPSEILVLGKMGVNLIQHNEVPIQLGPLDWSFTQQGKRKVENPTIFFMPHCGQGLYNNVLLANWGPSLEHIFVLGNSFHRYSERWPLFVKVD